MDGGLPCCLSIPKQNRTLFLPHHAKLPGNFHAHRQRADTGVDRDLVLPLQPHQVRPQTGQRQREGLDELVLLELGPQRLGLVARIRRVDAHGHHLRVGVAEAGVVEHDEGFCGV
jgi:hypothetical protein